MTRSPVDPSAPFQTVEAASRMTGLSQFYIRSGCKDGSVPHIRVGRVIFVNVPELLDRLTRRSCGEEVDA